MIIYNDPIELMITLAKKQITHEHYNRTVILADDYMAIISGENQSRFLTQFVQRETAAAFAQRLAITKTITAAVAASLMRAFNKVSRNDKIKKRFDFKVKRKTASVKQMYDQFYGESKRKSRGVDYWFRNRFPELVFADPNCWIVLEWEGVAETEVPRPRPFEVASRDALNFEFEGEELKWLFTRQDYVYQKLVETGNNTAAGRAMEAEIEQVAGIKYTLYEKDATIVIRQVDVKALAQIGYEYQDGEILQQIGDDHFILQQFQTNLGYVPAFRVGYVRDIFTGGQTYVNPFHSAMCYFMKSVKTVSELDLTMTLHAFPQKLQYVERCNGQGKTKCNSGYKAGTTQLCGACQGSGFKLIGSSAQDVITLPMPEEGTENKAIMKLDDIVHYISPPIELIKFQKEYVYELKEEAHMAVFSSTIFIQKESRAEKTAYEVDTNMQSIYDTLEPYTEKYSELWREWVYTFAKLARVDKPEDFEIVHIFPSDLKLKTMGMILAELELANTSEAPNFLRDSLNRELAEMIFAGDELGMTEYDTKHKFYPFNGMTESQISTLLASSYVSKFTKVLYANYEAIMTDIMIEHPEFIAMQNHAEQWTILQDKTNEYIKEIDEQNPVGVIDFGSALDPDAKQKEGKPVGENNPNEQEEQEEEA